MSPFSTRSATHGKSDVSSSPWSGPPGAAAATTKTATTRRLNRKRISKRVRRQDESQPARRAILLGRGERDRPERVPRIEPALGESECAGGQPEPRTPAQRIPDELGVCGEETEAEDDEDRAVAEAELAEQVRKPERSGGARLAREAAGGRQPLGAVARERDRHDGHAAGGEAHEHAPPPPRQEVQREQHERDPLDPDRDRQSAPAPRSRPETSTASAASTAAIIQASLWPPPAKCNASRGFQPTNAIAAARSGAIRPASRAIASTK